MRKTCTAFISIKLYLKINPICHLYCSNILMSRELNFLFSFWSSLALGTSRWLKQLLLLVLCTMHDKYLLLSQMLLQELLNSATFLLVKHAQSYQVSQWASVLQLIQIDSVFQFRVKHSCAFSLGHLKFDRSQRLQVCACELVFPVISGRPRLLVGILNGYKLRGICVFEIYQHLP